MKIGIVGLPNVGKSTLFNALTRKKVDISNYPFCTIEPNVGVVQVPDERLYRLAELSKSKKTVPAIVEFVDIAGLVKGAAEGEGLGNKFLAHIKEMDAIAEVIRVFEDENITHVGGRPNPVSDMETVEYELILKDLETVSKRLSALQAEVKLHKKDAQEKAGLLEKLKMLLQKGFLASAIYNQELGNSEKDAMKNVLSESQLLTAKPFLYILNISEEQLKKGYAPDEKLKTKIGDRAFAPISAKIESEMADLSDADRKDFLAEFGLEESGLNKLIKISYKTLGLVTFLTTGEDETRAWTISCNSSAPRAGRAIHSDFENKFIRAEIINWRKLLDAGSWARARELGWLRTEGKEYIVQDGDVIEFKI